MKRTLSFLLTAVFLLYMGLPTFALVEDVAPASAESLELLGESSELLGESSELLGESSELPEESSELPEESSKLSPDVKTDEEPSLVTELVTEGGAPGLYITLKNVPQDLCSVSVNHAFGSAEYIFEDRGASKFWHTKPDEELGQEHCPPVVDGTVSILCYRADEHPLSAYLAEKVNTLWIQVSFETEDWVGGMNFDPVFFSHGNTYEKPETPPPFTADFKFDTFDYNVIGHFADFPPNVTQVSPTYSWDGVNYQYTGTDGFPVRWSLQGLGNEDAAAKALLQNQQCTQAPYEPMVSFLARERDCFYLRLEITVEDGEPYYSQPVLISRDGTVSLPDHLTPRAYMGFDMSVSEERNDKGLSEDDENYYNELVTYTYGQLQLTVREDATPAEIRTLLPDTVPVWVIFWDKQTNEKVGVGRFDCKVNWKQIPMFSLTAGEPLTLKDMAQPLVMPAGTEIQTDIVTYRLTKPLTFRSLYNTDDIHIILNPVAAGDEPRVGLWGDHELVPPDEPYTNNPLSVAFWQKPSGATSIKAYAVVGDERTEICDLLARRDINHNQSHELYGYVPLLEGNEAPYVDYLSWELGSFTIELDIKGGVYDGKTVALPWPYEYDLPQEIPDPDGWDGQENNAGADNWEDSDEGGQRPGISGGGSDSPKDTSPEPVPPPESLPAPPLTLPVVTQPAEAALPSSDAWDEKEARSAPEAAETAPGQEDINMAPTRPVEPTANHLPVPATAALVILGGAAATAIGAAGAGVTASGGVGKLLDGLRKLLFQK